VTSVPITVTTAVKYDALSPLPRYYRGLPRYYRCPRYRAALYNRLGLHRKQTSPGHWRQRSKMKFITRAHHLWAIGDVLLHMYNTKQTERLQHHIVITIN